MKFVLEQTTLALLATHWTSLNKLNVLDLVESLFSAKKVIVSVSVKD